MPQENNYTVRSIELETNPVVLAEAIANMYDADPRLVFLRKQTKGNKKYDHIRAEWVKRCIHLGLSITEVKEISNWGSLKFQRIWVMAFRK
jgi:hypothetical protein